MIFNGTTVIDVTDTGRAAGAIALDVSNQPIEFDDIVVTQTSRPPPARRPTSAPADRSW